MLPSQHAILRAVVGNFRSWWGPGGASEALSSRPAGQELKQRYFEECFQLRGTKIATASDRKALLSVIKRQFDSSKYFVSGSELLYVPYACKGPKWASLRSEIENCVAQKIALPYEKMRRVVSVPGTKHAFFSLACHAEFFKKLCFV